MGTEGLEHSVLREVSEWRQRGIELRTRLLKEREELAARLKEIDEALANIPESSQPQQVLTPSPLFDLSIEENSSVPDLVRFVLTRFPGGNFATDIVDKVRKIRPALDAPVIHSAIHRLAKSGEIIIHGKRGSMKYWLKGDASANGRES